MLGAAPTGVPIAFTLELFPPKTEAGVQQMLETLDSFIALKPDGITVTFGAGGSAMILENMHRAISRIATRAPLPVAAHITCAGRSRAEADALIDGFWAMGIRQLVALRGDILQTAGAPPVAYAPHPDGYAYTQDFIASIRARYPQMMIAVAGYPETHPESPSMDFDIAHLKRKVDAGGDVVLTQFFFDPDVFLRWRDAVQAAGVTVPLVPGLLPILNFEKMLSFAARCNANVPEFLHRMFAGVAPDSVDHKLLAMNVLSHQITRLIEHGVRRFHFYTLNDTLLTRHLCTWLRAGF